MKKLFFLWILFSFIPHIAFSAAPGGPADRDALTKANPHQALAIANEWRWSHPEINSYITPREIVFKFPDAQITKIPLPVDKMMVAVAPYLTQTHS